MKTVGPIELGETKALRFEFESEITNSAAALSLPSVSVSVLDGVDATPTTILVGGPTIEGNEVVQVVNLTKVGVTYKLKAWLTEGGVLRHGVPCKVSVVPG